MEEFGALYRELGISHDSTTITKRSCNAEFFAWENLKISGTACIVWHSCLRMVAGIVLTSSVTLLLLWTVDGSEIKDNRLAGESSPLHHIFSKNDLMEYEKRCRRFKEEEQKNFLEVKFRENAKGCSDIDNFIKVLANEGLLKELMPAAEHADKLSFDDHLENEEYTLMMSREAALLSSKRGKRATFVWTCSQIRSIPMLFLTATAEEITAMDNTEFTECIPDIGKLTDLKSQQRDALLAKAKTALSKNNVCEMETSDLVNLGVVALAFEETDLSCLPLSDSSLVTSLGSLEEWTTAELTALAVRYMSTNTLSDLSTLTSDDITMLGSIFCGFTANQIATAPSAEIGKSGAHIGALHECSIAQLTELVKLATQADAYGPVSTLDAAEITELGYLIAGVSGTEIKELTVAAIEGLDADVIPLIPAAVLKEMTTDQFQSFTDAQAVSITDDQKAVMTEEQKTLLGGQATGGEEVLEEVVINEDGGDDGGDSSAGSFIEISCGGLGLMMALVLLT
ncbi:uncharacterized protein LOC123563183 isoform X2 [Mercenaria mercenaria]|uniref:uncharacterized protein LOC123563183 isoform X2 n=1 Tax=Mercenaria mercenaria TaxID=6596 RepID=UPI00234EB68F|nr:uncharacterized protein LOC123563183 isoform X2 [Mercenaria mercenaria]